MYKYWNGYSLEALIAKVQQACTQGVSFEQYLGYILDIDRLLYAQLPHELRYAELSIWMAFECITGILLHTKGAKDKAHIFSMTKAIREYIFKQRPNNPKNIRIWPLLEEKLFFGATEFNKEEHRKAQLAHEKLLTTINQHAIPRLQDFLQTLPGVDKKINDIILRYQALAQILEEFNSKKLLGRIKDKRSIFDCILSLAAYFAEEGDLMLKEKHVRWTEAYHLALGFYQIALRGQYLGSGFEEYHTVDLALPSKIAALEDAFMNALDAKQKRSSERGHASLLAQIREKSRQSIEPLLDGFPEKDSAWLEKGKLLQPEIQQLHEELKGFIGELFTDAMACLGKPPCQFSVIGFGSLEKGSATLYSDVELGILLREDSDTDEARDYFRRLSHVVQVEVIRLGESPIAYSIVGIDCDDLLHSGFCFDLGGKTPLGRRELAHDTNILYGELRYELIGAPSRLIQYIEDKYFYIDRLLPIELSRCTHIFGQIEITAQYQGLLKQRFNKMNSEGINLYQERAHLLLLGKPEFALQGDLDKYVPDLTEEGKPYDIKQEVYRLPDRLIDSLAFYYGLVEGNNWQKISRLEADKVITREQGQHLRILDLIATETRLRTYQHYGKQHEFMSVFPRLQGETFVLENANFLLRFYATALPFLNAMRDWCAKQTSLASAVFWDDSALLRGEVMLRLAQYEKAATYLQHYVNSLDIVEQVEHRHRAKTYLKLADAYRKNNAKGLAKKYVEQALKSAKIFSVNHEGKEIYSPLLLKSLSDLAGIFYVTGDINQAEEYYKDVLVKYQSLYSGSNECNTQVSILIVLYNLVEVLIGKNQFQQAAEYSREALTLCINLYGEIRDHDLPSYVPGIYRQHGNILNKLGSLNQAKQFCEEALKKYKTLYGGVDEKAAHPEIELSMNEYAGVLSALGNSDLAKQFHEQALEMAKVLHPSKAHPRIARALNNLAEAYGKLGNFEQAKRIYEKALAMYKELNCGSEMCLDIAMSLHGLGFMLYELGKSKQARKHRKKVLLIVEALHNKGQNVDFEYATVLSNIDDIIEDNDLAKTYYEKALAIQKKLYGGTDGQMVHADIARTLNNFAFFYADKLKDFKKAEELHKQALMMREKLYGGADGEGMHPDIAETLNNLGFVLQQTEPGNISKVIEFYEKALLIESAFYGGTDGKQAHPKIASTLYNLATVLNKLEDPMAKTYYEESLRMGIQLYPPNDLKIVNALESLACFHFKHNNKYLANFYHSAAQQAKKHNYLLPELLDEGAQSFLRASEKDMTKFMKALQQAKIDKKTQSYWYDILSGKNPLLKTEDYNKAIAKLPNNFCKKIAKSAKNRKIVRNNQPIDQQEEASTSQQQCVLPLQQQGKTVKAKQTANPLTALTSIRNKNESFNVENRSSAMKQFNLNQQASLAIELQPSELCQLTVEQLIEVALQLDRGMYPLLPKRWQNPGVAGLCSFLILADRLKQAENSATEPLTPETQFLQTIDETCQHALELFEKEGLKARIKPLMNELYEYAGGFERRMFEESEFVSLKATIKDVACNGQLIYRVRDKLFFVLVDERYIEKTREHFSTLDRPRAEIGSAHIILNEGMPMEESAKWYETLCQRYQKTHQHVYGLAKGDSDFIYFDKRISFKVVGAYAGLPKTNSRLRQTLQWCVESDEISQLNEEGLRSHLNDYCYHITFAEEARKPHPIMAKCSSIEDLLDKQSHPMHSHLYNLLMVSSHTQHALIQEARKASREGRDKLAINYYQEAIEVGESHSKATYLCRIRLAKHWYFDNQMDKANAELDRVYKDIQENTVEAPDVEARCYQWLAKLHYRTNRWEDAKDCCFKAKAAWESVQQNAEETQRLRAIKGIAKALSDLGNIEARQGNYQKALQYQLEAQKIIESLPDEQKQSESAAWIYGNLGNAYRAIENNDKALYWLKKAHKLRKIILGPTHPACTGNLLTIAELYSQQHQWGSARKRYQKIVDLRQTHKGHVDKHLAAAYYGLGMSYLAKFEYDDAILQFKAALSIDKQLNEPSQHAYEHVVRDLIEIAKATFNQGGIKEAQSYCQQAEDRLQAVEQERGQPNLVLKDECNMLAIRIEISQKTDPSIAINRAKALQERNQRFIEESQKTSTLSDFDFLDYTPILRLLADVYISTKNPEAAYWVFLKAVEKWWEEFPHVTSLWLKNGLKIAYSNGLDTRLIANAYVFQGKIRYQQECYRAALKSAMKSQHYNPSQEAENDCAIYQQKVKQRLEIMDEDLFHQLEDAKEGYHAVCIQYLCDLEHGTQLSVYAVNRTTEVLIKLRNILDMSYARFIRKAIYGPNQKGGELYYPMFSSRAALEKSLINQKILFRPQLSISEVQSWLNQKGIIHLAFNELKKAGIIKDDNGKFILTECKDDDNCWNTLSIHLDPCFSFLNELVIKCTVGDIFDKSTLGKLELSKYYQDSLPGADKVWERLIAKGIINEIKTNKANEKIAWLINDNILGQVAIELHCPNDGEDDKRRWHGICRILAEKLQEKIKHPEHIQHLENAKYLTVWENILQEQPFAYFANGYTHSGEMQGTWLEKLSGIQNDSKHIRLTPQGIEHRLLMRQSQVKRRDVKVFIHYLDPLIYPWTFAEELHERHSLSMNKEKAFEISRMLVNWLKEFKYIDQRRVSALSGLEMIHIARSKGKGQAFEDAKEKLKKQLHDDLDKHKQEWLSYEEIIFDILCKKLLQRGYIELFPDKIVEQRQLMNNVIFHVDALVNIFGQALEQHLETSIQHGNDIMDTYWGKCQKPNALKALVLEYLNANRKTLSVDHYLKLAQKSKENHPWLSYIYYERARDIAIHKEGDYQRALHITVDMAEFSREQGWYSRTQRLLQEAINYPISEFLKKGGERCKEMWNGFIEEEKTRDQKLDTDLNVQLVHCREMLAILYYKIFALYQNPEDAILLQQIQGMIADLLIKIRHLFDQAMDRFVRTCINDDNDKLISIWGAKYPCTRDEVELKNDFLCLKEQLGKADFEKIQQQLNDKMIANDSKFHVVYEHVYETQAYNNKNNSWLRRIVNYSNQLKHVKFRTPDVDVLKKRREQCGDDLDEFYPILQSGYLVLNDTPEWESLIPTLRCAINEIETTLDLLFEHIRKNENQHAVNVKGSKDNFPPVSYQIKFGFCYSSSSNVKAATSIAEPPHKKLKKDADQGESSQSIASSSTTTNKTYDDAKVKP